MVRSIDSAANDSVEARLDRLSSVFDLDLYARAASDARAIQSYYRLTRHAYSRYHDRGNAVHMGLSDGDTFHPDDFQAQAKIVEQWLPDRAEVLELATGRGMNALWLARRHPDAKLHGLDLTEAQLAYARRDGAEVANFHPAQGDFHDLSRFSDASLDLAFVVEALCHSDDKARVMAEVGRALRPGGVFIVIDGYRTRAPSACSEPENRALALLARGMAVTAFHPYDQVRAALTAGSLDLVEEQDRSHQLMPSLRRHGDRALRFLGPSTKAWFARRLLPRAVLGTVITGALFPVLLDRGLISYWVTVLRKPQGGLDGSASDPVLGA